MKNHGLSFIEITLIIIVISILASVGMLKYTSNQDNALKAALTTNLADLRQAINLYYLKNDAYPDITSLQSQFIEGHFPINPINKISIICPASATEAQNRTIPSTCSNSGWAYYVSTTTATIYAASSFQFADGVAANNL